jgi:hypothetical protein
MTTAIIMTHKYRRFVTLQKYLRSTVAASFGAIFRLFPLLVVGPGAVSTGGKF